MTDSTDRFRTATLRYTLIGARVNRIGNNDSMYCDDRYPSRYNAVRALIQRVAADQRLGYAVTVRVRLPYSYRSPFAFTVSLCPTCSRPTQHVDGWCAADHS